MTASRNYRRAGCEHTDQIKIKNDVRSRFRVRVKGRGKETNKGRKKRKAKKKKKKDGTEKERKVTFAGCRRKFGQTVNGATFCWRTFYSLQLFGNICFNSSLILCGKIEPPYLGKENCSRHKSSTTRFYQCVQCFCVSKQWCGSQLLGFLTCAQM